MTEDKKTAPEAEETPVKEAEKTAGEKQPKKKPNRLKTLINPKRNP